MNNFDEYLMNYVASFKDNLIKEAMIYSLDGGKRFRPNVLFSIIKGCGLEENDAYPAALAIEFIQSYSLIHDDLPGMDNDDYRRGKLSCHKRFGEDIAILTGDALLTHAFECISNSNYDDKLKVNLINILVKYAGLEGMIYGQLLDVTANTNINKEQLFEIHDNKTGGLFKYACLAAMYIASSKLDIEIDYNYYEALGSKMGIIFQSQDDLFDIIKTENETGKSNSDSRNQKITALSFMSVDELKEHIDFLFKDIKNYLSKANFDTKYLLEILERMQNR